eukprot:2857787-Prymnesium_polylepis.1
MGFRGALLKERVALEDRLSHINKLLQGDRPAEVVPLNGEGLETFWSLEGFAVAVGLDVATV